MLKSNNKTEKVDVRKGFYSNDMFRRRLEEERRRSERSGLPFTVLSLTLSDSKGKGRKSYVQEIELINKYISEIVVNNCRRSDVKTWENETELKILLPDTSLVAANNLKDKLENNLNNGFKAKLQKKKINECNAKISVSSYPEFFNIKEKEDEKLQKQVGEIEIKYKENESDNQKIKKMYSLKWGGMKYDIMALPLYSDLFFKNDIEVIEKKIKRGIDIVGSLIGCTLFMPIMILIAIIIKVSTKGPILYKQERLGFLGEKFDFYKFRTMYYECDDTCHKQYVKNLIQNKLDKKETHCKEKKVYKIECDNRITPIGRFLRKTSLDELPQFFNVLIGDMSLVGPRPPIQYEVKHYQKWHLQRVLEVKPGITGLWQVDGRSRTTFDEMVRMDIAYLNSYSLWLDLKIIFKTIYVVFTGKGGY